MGYLETQIGKAKMKEEPKSPFSFKLKENAVKNQHLDDNSVNTRVLMNKSVTPEKVSDNFQHELISPLINYLNQKFTNITNELYDMINSLQVGGVALSRQFGSREDIGITQNTLTKMFGAIWDTIENYHPGHNYFDFTLTVNPIYIYNEIVEDPVRVIADCSQAISDFDSIKIYINNELEPRVESSDLTILDTTIILTGTSTIKAVGTILGKEIVKTAQVINEVPFFIGSGNVYTDIMNEGCRQELIGTIEGNYDMQVNNNGEHIFIIIPLGRMSEYRRADMNGYEIPFEAPIEMTDYVIYKSLNTYQAGTYNIDIDINS